MSEMNFKHNRAVWFDIPVADLDRAATFYSKVLAIEVSKESMGNIDFCVLEHKEGNGGCLVPRENEIAADSGILLYMNVDGRIRDAVDQVEKCGGTVTDPVSSIGEHGFRALFRDSEGNRLALHSTNDS